MEERSIPDQFFCPISLEMMTDPVIAADGITYQRANIQKWFSKTNHSPYTNKTLPHKTLITNYALKGLIGKYVKKQSKSEFKQSLSLYKKQLKKQSKSPLQQFLCPLSFQMFQNPVVANDGYTYQKKQIQSYLEKFDKSPITNLPLQNKTLIPNNNLKSIIEKYQNDQFYFRQHQQFTCPISCQIMQDPVILEDGATYERRAIQEWLIKRKTSPKTGLKLTSFQLTPNRTFKNIIGNYMEYRNLKIKQMKSLQDKQVTLKPSFNQFNKRQYIYKSVQFQKVYYEIKEQNNYKKAIQRIQEIQYEDQEVATLLCDQIMNKEITEEELKKSQILELKYIDKVKNNTDCTEMLILVLKRYLEEQNAKVIIEPQSSIRSALTLKAFSTGFMMDRIKFTQEFDESQLKWDFKQLKQSNAKLELFENWYKKRVNKETGLDPKEIVIHKLVHCCIQVEWSISNTQDAAGVMKKMKHLKLHPYFNNFVLSPEDFDPKGNIVFRDSKNDIERRGCWPYYQPIKSKRYGFNVTKKYDNGDDTWLKMQNCKGQWAVAFHGARNAQKSIKNILNGLKKGEMLAIGDIHKCRRNKAVNKKNGILVQKGIYCTPHIKYSLRYTTPYEVPGANQKYRLVFQCRVNPRQVKVCQGYEQQWVLNNSRDIRPYGIVLIKQQNAVNYPTTIQQFKQQFTWNKYKDQIQKAL